MSLNLDIDSLPPEQVEAAISRLETMKAQRAAEKKYGTVSAAPLEELPPKGPPGVKGRRLRGSVENALTALANGESDKATETLRDAKKRYDANEA